MANEDNVVLLTWQAPLGSKAYQAYSNLKELASNGAVDLKAAAVIESACWPARSACCSAGRPGR